MIVRWAECLTSSLIETGILLSRSSRTTKPDTGTGKDSVIESFIVLPVTDNPIKRNVLKRIRKRIKGPISVNYACLWPSCCLHSCDRLSQMKRCCQSLFELADETARSHTGQRLLITGACCSMDCTGPQTDFESCRFLFWDIFEKQ